jgi:hypothetical protein
MRPTLPRKQIADRYRHLDPIFHNTFARSEFDERNIVEEAALSKKIVTVVGEVGHVPRGVGFSISSSALFLGGP